MPIVGQPAQVTLNTLAAGPIPPNAVHARIIGPSGNIQDAIVTPAPQGYHLRFNVPEPGSYIIEADVCTLPLRPVQITAVEPLDPSKVRAYGPGLSQGTVNKPADFIVDTRGAGNGQLGVTVEGPSESKIDYQDNNDGSCRVTYHPTGTAFPSLSPLHLSETGFVPVQLFMCSRRQLQYQYLVRRPTYSGLAVSRGRTRRSRHACYSLLWTRSRSQGCVPHGFQRQSIYLYTHTLVLISLCQHI